MQKNSNPIDRITITLKNISVLLEPIKILFEGIKTNTIPWKFCAGWAVCTSLVIILKIDHFLISNTRFSDMYPYSFWLYRLYTFSFSTLGFWIWAWIEVKKKKDRLKLLTDAFKNAGLQSKIGRLPQLISDNPIDPMTRKMRLTNAGFPLETFRNHSKFVESELGVFIDEMRENRERRSVDVIYSHYPMAEVVVYNSKLTSRPYEFPIGQTRANATTSSFKESPHLLVAGQTGGGKSTFLRQFIVHLATIQKSCKFLLIDLKGGLEFSLFENRKQFVVVPHVKAAIEELLKIDKLLDTRMAFLKKNQCKDIEAYFKKDEKNKNQINLDRQVVVVDEAAEMFLAGHHAKAKDIQEARGILSRIARQGRAVGIHLVIATQRPDSRSLDPQVKANLTGVLCFQMMNDSSSIAVLGNGRATDLPKVPGRAIWKNGIEMIEVQTPLLTTEEAEILLGAPDNVSSGETKGSTETQLDDESPKILKNEETE